MVRDDDHNPARPEGASERARLDPFVVAAGDAPPRDQRDLMERPFFSLAKSPRTKPILYKAADVEVQVLGMPEHGMATIWDADVLIWAASQIVAAENSGLPMSPDRTLTAPQVRAAMPAYAAAHPALGIVRFHHPEQQAAVPVTAPTLSRCVPPSCWLTSIR